MRVSPPRRILVVMTRRIGDVLLVTPLIRSLKAHWPQAGIDALVFAGTAGVLAANPDLHEVITVSERPTASAHSKLLARLFRRYDLALSALSGDRSTLYAWLAGKRRFGLLGLESSQRWKRRLLDGWVPFDDLDTHTVAMNLQLSDLLGVPRHADVIAAWSEADGVQAREAMTFDPAQQPYMVIHPYPKFNYKMWRLAGWAEFGNWAALRGLRVVVTGSNDAAELDYVAQLLALLPRDAVSVAGRLTLGQVAWVLHRAALYVGPDTATTHMAAALHVPTVALFGPSNPVKWAPWPADCTADKSPWRRGGSQQVGNVSLVQGTGGPCVPCPCMQEGCERHVASFSECLQSMSTATVVRAAEALLESTQAPLATIRASPSSIIGAADTLGPGSIRK